MRCCLAEGGADWMRNPEGYKRGRPMGDSLQIIRVQVERHMDFW